MVDYTNPVFWFFFTLVGASLIVLRVRDPGAARPFRVPLYPVTPIILTAGGRLPALAQPRLRHASDRCSGAAVLAVGVPVLLWARSRDARGAGSIRTAAPGG